MQKNKKTRFTQFKDLSQLKKDIDKKIRLSYVSFFENSSKYVFKHNYNHIIHMIKLMNRLDKQTEKDREIIINILVGEAIKYSNIKGLQIANNHELVGSRYYGYVDTMVINILNNNYVCLISEAKKDNFELGEAQLIAELNTIYETNKKSIVGIVTNLNLWCFYKYSEDNDEIKIDALDSLKFDFKSENIKEDQITSIINTIIQCIYIGTNSNLHQ